MVYEMDAAEKKQLCVDKVESQFARALRYVEAIGATTVVPSAGPPCFLDDDLFHLNMITGDEASIFRWNNQCLVKKSRVSSLTRLNTYATTRPISTVG
jgi:hypothetical protein